MDSPSLDRREHHRALDALGRANIVSRTAAIFWPSIQQVAAERPDRRVSILELACGGGHVATSLAQCAVRRGITVDLLACDMSPVALDYAEGHARQRGASSVRFRQLDALRDPLPEGFDVVLCSLFLHHLDDAEAEVLLWRMRAAARRLILVSDLRRSVLGYLFTRIGCRLLSRSKVFHVDGVRSIHAAFTSSEADELAARAGLTGARVTDHWPQRFLIAWRPDGHAAHGF